MILADTSAWIEYLRSTGSPAHQMMRDLVARPDSLGTTEIVVMELLSGARDDRHASQLRRLVSRAVFLPVHGLDDHEEAASLYRRCRRAGSTVRALTDCLIAAVAIRVEAEVLHHDRDFDVLARHTELMMVATSAPPAGS